MTTIGPTARRIIGVKLPEAIGHISALDHCLVLCMERIRTRGQHFILVDPKGSVYAVPTTDIRTYALVEKTPTWLAGVFQAMDKIGGKIVGRLNVATLREAIRATHEAMA